MKPHHLYSFLLCIILLQGCCGSASICDRGTYQETSTAIIRAHGLVNAKFPSGIPANFDGTAWKALLQEKDLAMYSLVEPYDAKISPANTGYVLTLSENGTDFVLDYSCTTKIDYWLCEVDVKKVALVDPCK